MRLAKEIRAKVAKVAAVAFAMPPAGITFVTLLVALALGAGAANALERSGEPSDIARRAVPAMATPAVAITQMSTMVTGVLAAPEPGPAAGHQMNFQNRMSGNLYNVRTDSNGAFSVMLPPGAYDLRGIHGAVIVADVVVGQAPVNLGQVTSPGPYNVWRLVERQYISQAIVSSPSPAAAYLPNLQGGPQPVSVTPVVSPPVMGAGPNGEPLAPAVVIPPSIFEQTEIPAGADVPPAGVPPALEMAPPSGPGGGY